MKYSSLAKSLYAILLFVMACFICCETSDEHITEEDPEQENPKDSVNLVRSNDYILPVTSTVPNFEGAEILLSLHEKVSDSLLASNDLDGKVVLLVHATITPSSSTYDLQYEDYSMMGYLAEQGLDVFTFDFSGYGNSSSLPPMNDSCNLDPGDKTKLGIQPCVIDYPYFMTTSFSELDEIDAVVEYIKKERGVNKVHIFGTSLGGIRSLNYAMTKPDNIDRLSVQGVSRYLGFSIDPTIVPAPGVPMGIITEAEFLDKLSNDIVNPGQRDVAIHAQVWSQLRELDSIGLSWGIGGIRSPSLMLYGFERSDIEQLLTRPSLILSGENDRILNPLLPIRSNLGVALYNDMSAVPQKIHLTIENTGHIALYDISASYMFSAISDWFLNGKINDRQKGVGKIDVEGNYSWED